jgi:hypothetical protein
MNKVTVAISERAIREVVSAVEKAFSFSSSGETGHSGNVLRVGYDMGGHAEKGVISLIGPKPRPFYDGGIADISGVNIIWDQLDCYLDISIPQVCLGGFCILPTPWGCAINAPRACFFGNTIRVKLDLGGGLIVSRVSLAFAPEAKQTPQQWQILAHAVYSNVDVINWAATLDNVAHAFVNAIVDDLLGFLPDWAKDLIKSVLGDLADWVSGLIGLGPKVIDWLQQLLGVSLNIFDIALVAVAQHFESKLVLLSIDNPYKLMDLVPPSGEQPALPAVFVPVKSLAPDIEDAELIGEVTV